jgi:hypothetical protein
MYSARVTFLGLFTSLAVLPIGWSASASTFQYEGYTVANAQVIQVQAPNNIALEIGQITLHGAGVDAGQSIAVWCLDIFNLLTTSATFNVGPLTTAGAGGSNPTLSAAQISEIGSLMMHGNALINSNTDVSAATQLAIWTVEYGNAFKFSGASSTLAALAQQFVSNVMVGGQWNNCPTCAVTLFSSDGDQNMGQPSPVPLPGALPLFATGLGALALLGRRRRKRGTGG